MGAPSPAVYSSLLSALLLATAALPCQGSDACPSSAWISFGRSCYALLPGPWGIHSIDDAREYCRGNASGADIISINNKEENTFIQKSFCSHWHGPEYISLGMFFDTDDDDLKWYDKSNVSFTNWMEEESNKMLLDTCATMHTTSGGWKKTGCEQLPLNAILCEVPTLYEKKYILAETAWTTTLVITSTVIVAVSAAILWFLYQRRVSSGAQYTIQNSTTEIPYGDEAVLIDEENEHTA
ncbi:CD302 antigen [Elgaria multicarinata webbii]|uniref:CD302 antigen n=1 Tax=Elgaria multicarinata webbii TaxID=159646 RepID=UPI002FCD307C